MAKTKIPWATESLNPIRYRSIVNGLEGWMCTKVSPGCLRCYAESENLRFGNHLQYVADNCRTENFHLLERVLNQPLHWRKPRRVFVQSMGDLFHEKIPDIFIDRICAVMALCPEHTFLSLTKRPDRMIRWFRRNPEYLWKRFILPEVDKIHSPWQSPCRYIWPLPNLWLGVSVETEKYLHRINALNEIAATIKFVSFEPLLEDMNVVDYLKYLNWVIVGPETGSGRRPCNIEWIENIVEQCDAAGVPVFVKAVPMGKRISHDPGEWPEKVRKREFP